MAVASEGPAVVGRPVSSSISESLTGNSKTLPASTLVRLLMALTVAGLSVFTFGRGFTTVRLKPAPPAPSPQHMRAIDNDLVDDISRRSFRYFWEETDLRTGLVLDRANVNGGREDNLRHRGVASIAATGFGLTALCIGAEHRWISPELARERILTTLRFFAQRAPQQHGWFYHYLDAATGQRRWQSEVSSIDTALLLAGVLTARQAFHDDHEVVDLATAIYNRVDFPWMLHGSSTLSHGWTPESGFLKYRWDTYSEHMILYTLAIGSPVHPIAPTAWYTWKLPVVAIDGYSYIGGGPLFIQQYSQAWIDLRDRVPVKPPPMESFRPRINYFNNSITATRAQQAFSLHLAHQFPGYSSDIWGITASDSSKGYVAWGGSPQDPRIDGTVVPSAAGGSLMFAPDICIPALRAMLLHYGKKIYGRYGFVDAFNPTTGWVSGHVIGIDVGITLLSAENLRTGKVWDWFMANSEANRALDLVGLVPAGERAAGVQRVVSVQSTQAANELDSQTEIPLARNVEIPRSSYEFKILVLPP